MTGQSAVQALPWFNVSENACNAGLPFLAPAEQVIAQDQTEYDNAKSKSLLKNAMIVIPMAIQNNIKPSIRFTGSLLLIETSQEKVSFLNRIGYTIEYVIVL